METTDVRTVTLQVSLDEPAGEWLELDVTGYDLYESLLVDPLDVDDEGRIAVPTSPGIGAELPAEVVGAYA